MFQCKGEVEGVLFAVARAVIVDVLSMILMRIGCGHRFRTSPYLEDNICINLQLTKVDFSNICCRAYTEPCRLDMQKAQRCEEMRRGPQGLPEICEE